MRQVVYNILLIFCVSFVSSEIFSAIEELENQFNNNKLLIDELETFAEKINDDYVYRKLKAWKVEYNAAEADVLRYITNPLNAFLIIKRSTEDVELIEKRFPEEGKIFVSKVKSLQPSKIDLQGAVEGLLRLQFFYKLKTTDFANGIIDGNQTRTQFSVHDLYVIGLKAKKIESQDYFALEYLQLAYEKLQHGFDVDNEVNENLLIRHLIAICKRIKNYAKAFEMLEVLKIKYPLAEEDDYYARVNKSLHADQNRFDENYPSVNDPFSDNYLHDGTFNVLKDRIINSQICRENASKSTKDNAKLRCRYVSTNSFSILARFKVEEVHLEPYIVMFIDVVSDDELQILKDSSKLNLSRAVTTSGQMVSSRRVAKVSWHYEHEHEFFRKLSRRVEDMTGLSQETFEPLQTQNYGIGGHYDGHWDCYMKFDTPFENGNRIATVLFYLSDVEKGGGTVFSYLKLHVKPRKGAAIFWYNLSSSGSCDFLTRHSACPVLLGSKWVSNQWIGEYGNEFRKPCAPGQIYNYEKMLENTMKNY